MGGIFPVESPHFSTKQYTDMVLLEDFYSSANYYTATLMGATIPFNRATASVGAAALYTGAYSAAYTGTNGALGRRGILQITSGASAGNNIALLSELNLSLLLMKKLTFGLIPGANESASSATPTSGAGNLTQYFGISATTAVVNASQTANTIIWRLISTSSTIPVWAFVVNNVVQYTLPLATGGPGSMTQKWSRIEFDITPLNILATSFKVNSTWYDLTSGVSYNTGDIVLDGIGTWTGYSAQVLGITMSNYTANATNKYLYIDYVQLQMTSMFPVGATGFSNVR